MIQQTLTVKGMRYSGKRIAKLLDPKVMTIGGDYIIDLNGCRYYANYRQIQDSYYAPVCDEDKANAISLMEDNGTYTWSIWLTLGGK